MSRNFLRAAVLTATAISAIALQGGAASAATCNDVVVSTIHAAHERTGDPAGAGHAAEETYCGVKP